MTGMPSRKQMQMLADIFSDVTGFDFEPDTSGFLATSKSEEGLPRLVVLHWGIHIELLAIFNLNLKNPHDKWLYGFTDKLFEEAKRLTSGNFDFVRNFVERRNKDEFYYNMRLTTSPEGSLAFNEAVLTDIATDFFEAVSSVYDFIIENLEDGQGII